MKVDTRPGASHNSTAMLKKKDIIRNIRCLLYLYLFLKYQASPPYPLFLKYPQTEKHIHPIKRKDSVCTMPFIILYYHT